jgi:flagellar protein FlgJ
MTPTGFVRWLRDDALEIQERMGIRAKFLIAQAALETGWGAHVVTDDETGVCSNNLFNVKSGRSWLGPVARCWTHECARGERVRVQAEFRAYVSPQQSFEDYARLISQNPRYAQAWAVRADLPAFAQALQAAGYATDPQYAEKILAVADSLDLHGYQEA